MIFIGEIVENVFYNFLKHICYWKCNIAWSATAGPTDCGVEVILVGRCILLLSGFDITWIYNWRSGIILMFRTRNFVENWPVIKLESMVSLESIHECWTVDKQLYFTIATPSNSVKNCFGSVLLMDSKFHGRFPQFNPPLSLQLSLHF